MAPFNRRKQLASQAPDGAWLHDKAPSGPRRDTTSAVHAGPTTNKLVVSNLHYEVTTKDLMAIFGQIGTLVREPQIRYDRSGRSSGVAIITLETPAEATRAKQQMHGMIAKGQPMEIAFDIAPPLRQPRHSTPSSLINRIQKAPLIERLGRAEGEAKTALVKSTRGSAVARTRGKGARGAAAPVATPRAARAKPKTAAELDNELDAFMGGPPAAAKATGPQVQNGSAQDGDVEMQ